MRDNVPLAVHEVDALLENVHLAIRRITLVRARQVLQHQITLESTAFMLKDVELQCIRIVGIHFTRHVLAIIIMHWRAPDRSATTRPSILAKRYFSLDATVLSNKRWLAFIDYMLVFFIAIDASSAVQVSQINAPSLRMVFNIQVLEHSSSTISRPDDVSSHAQASSINHCCLINEIVVPGSPTLAINRAPRLRMRSAIALDVRVTRSIQRIIHTVRRPLA